MRSIGLDRAQPGPARIIEGMHEARIASEGLWRRDILNAVPLPQAVRAAKGGEPAFRGHASAGQDHDVANVRHDSRLGRLLHLRHARMLSLQAGNWPLERPCREYRWPRGLVGASG